MGLIASVGKIIIESAVVTAKLLAVPFGVPFEHSYHNDFKFTHNVVGEANNRPPEIFAYEYGFDPAGTGDIFSVQCAKCGIHGDFSADGRLAFSLKDGITDGKVKPPVYAPASVTNNPDAKCNNGAEPRAGVKNRIYVQALELWDYDIRNDILYEKGIACVAYAPL